MNPNILLVEDDPVSRAFLEAATAALPASVAVAADAASARRLANASAFDLWLIDANLPDATGAELLAQLREAGLATPALAHTATRDAGVHAELCAAGFVAVVAKPIDAASWQAALRRALGATSPVRANTPVGASGGKSPVWDDDAALAALNGNPKVEAVIHMKTLYLGPEELLVAAKIAVPKTTKAVEIAAAINAVEADVRKAVPAARVIYLEPDIYVSRGEHPSTDAIVIKSAD